MIKVNDVSMKFNLGIEKEFSLKLFFINMFKSKKNKPKKEEFWALKDISFEVKKGEVIGFIGSNGAGKSTMLKVIAGVMKPTKGKVEVNGNICPMIELGAGFDMDLTARENIYLNGAVLGYSKEFIEKKFDEIVEFSELRDFLDVPVRNFSSGMTARLAFSIATVVDPEILIVDEILSVGDIAFQKKSEDKMKSMIGGGTTVLFVSHSIAQIKKICNKVVWLEHGVIQKIGNPIEICEEYERKYRSIKMKKVIFFMKNLNIGGMEKALITLLNKMDLSQYNVTLVLEKKEGILLNEIPKEIDVIDYNLSSNKNIFIRKVINLIKKIKFTIKNYNKFDCSINYATYSVLGSQMARICSQNNVIFIHSDYYNVYNKNIEEIKNFCELIKLKKFKKIIFVSKHSRDNLINITPEIKEKSILLGNLVDFENIQKKSIEYVPVLEEGKKNLLFLGRLQEESKNISELIKANNKSKRKNEYNIIIIGDGPDKEKYIRLNKSTNIKFIGEQKNPYPYIKACDYIIITSKYEGFPVVYNEATVLNTKIITTIPVEDEEISYTGNNIMTLNSKLSNFNEIIDKILLENKSIGDKTINFKEINDNKIEKFYSIIKS